MHLPASAGLALARRDSEEADSYRLLEIALPAVVGIVLLTFALALLEGWYKKRMRGKQNLSMEHCAPTTLESSGVTLFPPVRPEPAAFIPAGRVRGYARIGSMDDILSSLSSNVEHPHNQRSQLASTDRVEPPGSSRSASSDGDISSNLPEYRSRFTGDTTPPEYRSNGSQSTHRSSWL